MKFKVFNNRTLGLLAVIIPLFAAFIYVGLRSGPLAPIAVTVVKVESGQITPNLFGIGTVAARYTFKIGPTFAGRIKSLNVQVNDFVSVGQLLGEMEPVDLDDRIRSQEAMLKRTESTLKEAQARQFFAQSQAQRYEQLLKVSSVSEESVAVKQQELQVANAVLAGARDELNRVHSDSKVLMAQKNNLRLIAPVDGIVVERLADPGTTMVAGQSVIEIIDPASLWVNVRFDQVSATGLSAGLPAQIILRSRAGLALSGKVLRTEPKADSITEEMLAKVVFNDIPQPLPPLGELAEVTVNLSPLPASLIIPNASIKDEGNNIGVWKIVDGELQFAAVTLGAFDLEGNVQVLEGLSLGDNIVSYSEKTLTSHSRIHIVERIKGTSR
ncbi:efflux RND transporter periplasmic adaptor subunit [Shewanella ulleungensis]|jgi:RND family efflux transporter MFP subunit|uniref:efflux RND transporter periplasmic adaptor subunit n=1 Tax=Shewanella ulleungensis TaxID=2282699 RepID=UPI003D79B1A6